MNIAKDIGDKYIQIDITLLTIKKKTIEINRTNKDQLFFKPINEDFVTKQINKLSMKKATGYDGISPKIINFAQPVISDLWLKVTWPHPLSSVSSGHWESQASSSHFLLLTSQRVINCVLSCMGLDSQRWTKGYLTWSQTTCWLGQSKMNERLPYMIPNDMLTGTVKDEWKVTLHDPKRHVDWDSQRWMKGYLTWSQITCWLGQSKMNERLPYMIPNDMLTGTVKDEWKVTLHDPKRHVARCQCIDTKK